MKGCLFGIIFCIGDVVVSKINLFFDYMVFIYEKEREKKKENNYRICDWR